MSDLRDGECVYCGEMTSCIPAFSDQWPMWFPERDGTGIARPHHTKCTLDRLAERDALEREVERLRAERERIYNLCVELGMYEPDEGQADVAVFIIACCAKYEDQVALANENDRLTSQLPRVGEAVKTAFLAYMRENQLPYYANEAARMVDTSAIIQEVTQLRAGADEVREVDNK